MGRWRASLLLKQIKSTSLSILLHNPISSSTTCSRPLFKLPQQLVFPISSKPPLVLTPPWGFRFLSANPCPSPLDDHDFLCGVGQNYDLGSTEVEEEEKEEEERGKIPVKAYFLCTSIDLKRMQAENSSNVIPPTSRSSNSIALRYCDFPSEIAGIEVDEDGSCWRYMIVFQYGSAVLFNIAEDEVDGYLELIRRHASGLLSEMRKDDYAVKEKPLLMEDMQGGADYIILKSLDIDGIRIIGSVLGQSIALDYFTSQVDGMLEEFTDINRVMENTGTFTMRRKKLFQLVGKANSNLADVILKVGLFDRSEIAWRDAKYSQILEYLREEYDVTQRFGNLDYKLKFVEHNVHFLQEALQNRKSDLLEWTIISLLSIQNVVEVCEIIHETSSTATTTTL